MTKQERVLLLVLAAAQFTHIMDFMIIMPLGPQLMRLFNINPGQFSLLVSAYTISAGVAGLLVASVIDRFDRKQALLFCYVGFSLGTIACASAPTYELLLLARSITGIFGGVLGALILAIVGDAIPNERRASAMGMVMAAFSVASVFGVPFGLYLANEFSWHAPFFFLAGIGALITCAIVFFVPNMKGHLSVGSSRPSPLEAFQLVKQNPNQQKALFFMVMLMFGQFTIIPFISPYMVANVGFTEHQLTYIYLLGGALTIFTSPLVGRMADKYGRLHIFTIFVCIALIPLFLITNMPPVPIAAALTVTGIFFIVAGGRMIPAMAMITSVVRPKNRGSFMSINSSVQQLAAGTASYIAGLIITKNDSGALLHYEYVGYIAIVASIITIFIARRLKAIDENKPELKLPTDEPIQHLSRSAERPAEAGVHS